MDKPTPLRYGDWVPGIATFAIAVFVLGFLGMGLVSDCQSDPTCLGQACQDDCSTTFLWRWALAAAVLAMVAGVSIRTVGAKAWLPVGLGGVVLVVLLIAFR